MKKSILITAAAVAVVLAVVLTAGCVGDNTQQQTAENSTLWMYTDDTGSTIRFIAMSPDGTGTFGAYKVETAENGEEEYKVITEHGFSWTKGADGKVKILTENKEEVVLTMDENRGLLTAESGRVYQLIPSELSGAVLGCGITTSTAEYFEWLHNIVSHSAAFESFT